jgi:flagellar assembly protein FliH
MPRRLSLESFDDGNMASTDNPSEGLAEEKWLEAFEKGYRDGWEDAERALMQRQGQISDEFSQRLQDLSFTLNEARASVRKEMSSLLRGVLDTMLPGALPKLLGPQIIADLDILADRVSDMVIEVVVAPEQQISVERMLASSGPRPARVIGRHGQPLDSALLRFGSGEREIDLGAALAEVTATLETYFDEPEQHEERAHG